MNLDDSHLSTPRLSTIHDVRRALHPLQAQADRVGRQVEEFAETLDRLSSLRSDSIRDSSKILPLVQRYEKIAKDTVVRLKRRHGSQRTEQWKENRKRKLNHGSALVLYNNQASQGYTSDTNVKDLLHWEQERQTWELLGLMLQIRYPAHDMADTSDYKPLQRPRDISTHMYSSQYSVYQNYLATADLAWERHVIREWLERSAEESREKVEDVMHLTAQQDKKSPGLVTGGWISSKEAIKGEKRLSSWAYALTPEQADSYKSIVNTGQSQTLITQMDPDAVTRQGRDLPPSDLDYERTTWIGCWELLRRGRPWEEIMEWCEDRDEGWRALSMRADPRLGKNKDAAVGISPARAHWQQRCNNLARGGGINDYERAVYGLLGGDSQSLLKVCESWDDQLFAHMSTQLSRGYDMYFWEQYGVKPPDHDSSAPESVLDKASLKSCLESLKTNGDTSEEAMSPFRSIQAAIMNNEPAQHLHNQGLQILPQLKQMAYSSLNLQVFKNISQSTDDITSAISIDDHDLIRILTHVLIFYQYLNPAEYQDPAMDNLIDAYIDFLGKAGKQQLLPLYSSFLTEDRASACLARQLPFIKDTAERQILIRLMERYGMDCVIVLLSQLDGIIDATPATEEPDSTFPKLELLEASKTNLRDVRNLRQDIIGAEIKPWEEDLIDTLEWFLLLKGDDKSTIYSAGIVVFKHLLKCQSYSAVCRLAQQIPSKRIAELVQLPGQINGHAFEDPQLNGGDMEMDLPDLQRAEARLQNSKENDLADVKIFQDLESFALVLQALSEWDQVVFAGTGARVRAHEGDKSELKPWKRNLQAKHDMIVERMQPLLSGWLLPTRGKTDAEMKELHQLRNCVLPELVLTYLSVLSFAGAWSGRENLLQCMNLAKEIADEDKDLCQAFVDAGRMAELMTTMANISRQILAAQETTGSIKMRKRRGGGELLDIWSIDAEQEG